jgi:hypothetical protein
MQLLEVSAKEGYVWFRQGVWLFRKNPLAFLMLLFIYLIAAQLAIFVPLFGIIALLVFTPGLSVGVMTACREVIQNKRVLPTVLLAGFRTNGKQATRNLLVLGGIYAVLVFALSLIATAVVDIGALAPMVLKGEEPRRSRAPTVFALMIGALLYTPMAMMFWFAPLLPPGMACRRSRRCSSAGPPAGATAARSSPTPCCSRCCWWRCRCSSRRVRRARRGYRAVVPGHAVLAADAGDPVLLVLRDLPRLLQHRAAGRDGER